MTKISAATEQEFIDLYNIFNTLPKSIRNQVSVVQKTLHGTECIIECTGDISVNLPSTTQKIIDYGEYIGVFTPLFFFKFIKGNGKNKIDYYFF